MNRHPGSSGQRGTALVVSLVLLLVMTMLGVAALGSSTMQGFMSSSYQRQMVLLSRAENRLLEGELDIEDMVVNGVAGRAHYINLAADPDAQFPATLVDEVWPEDRFVIEYMGEFQVPGESVAEGGGLEDSILHIFRVSARDDRPEDERGGVRVVQSLYVTLTGPDE